MQKERLHILQNMPVFGGIREDILEYLLDMVEIVSVPEGKYFFREGETSNCMFVLEQGKVAVLKSWKGRDYLLMEFGKGDCFGEMSLIDLGPRTASVLALEACSALKLSNTTILRIYQQDLEQFTMIQMNMGREVSRRLRRMDEELFQMRVETQQIREKP
ncbi:cyclic nucleotide-binding domain-containing protein [candidate division KSB3 bacterium]|uniref:Cyclic nucleotide-binding domain-containing protein n=1 Tax=candidate division KSB3 bacterium TaxID=2044937 RepID=A0A9D5JXU8_9BACT|nr:cyclic nucleotide-binding domain-containing protein [candidate division KSB3 bacterium]MBD3326163.1 cyclic nucleotide-binding domain-containing protein [candidate division KSB3 bacterium]